jgi:hypothetical protein
MARSAQRFNVDKVLNQQMANLASASQISKSEQLNIALKKALADPAAVINSVLTAPAQWSTKHMATFMIDKEMIDILEDASEKLAISKDTIVKLAMRSYVLSKIT